MAKTALEITPQERVGYCVRAAIERRQAATGSQVQERWQKAHVLARQAAHLLHDKFAARRVLLFGSALRRPWFTPWSDIDLAVWGLPPERFYTAVAAVTGLSDEICVDLVDPEQCSQTLRIVIEREGVEL